MSRMKLGFEILSFYTERGDVIAPVIDQREGLHDRCRWIVLVHVADHVFLERHLFHLIEKMLKEQSNTTDEGKRTLRKRRQHDAPKSFTKQDPKAGSLCRLQTKQMDHLNTHR